MEDAENLEKEKVASFTDAWIETYPGGSKKNAFESHLLQMRGLKHLTRDGYHLFFVASFTDAWIETCIICRKRKANASHLLQMRGLKLYQGNWDICIRRRIFYRCVD